MFLMFTLLPKFLTGPDTLNIHLTIRNLALSPTSDFGPHAERDAGDASGPGAGPEGASWEAAGGGAVGSELQESRG